MNIIETMNLLNILMKYNELLMIFNLTVKEKMNIRCYFLYCAYYTKKLSV